MPPVERKFAREKRQRLCADEWFTLDRARIYTLDNVRSARPCHRPLQTVVASMEGVSAVFTAETEALRGQWIVLHVPSRCIGGAEPCTLSFAWSAMAHHQMHSIVDPFEKEPMM